ncbi:MAG: DUF4878 domain-containing protein [Anaerolineae bacterium]|jgi:hypothetical protein|nr:DUF4878 domain-containing protein [Anaerolineae bacterium]MBT3712594.1 DUF4878 domain-containing protein [Anaerolineae bacterium]MBT4311611.1 DUF4878 domain-containing protein [Anaerolineae bacterium]MBT4459284.1 DUF4878 domain-containing protein [Anaerolineae bacterium]MBT4842123.1 DUF4878 domain-containing protein [Anaerolineae bacterium]
MKEDRFLTVILIVITLLVVASVSMFFLRQDSAVYLPEDTPEGIVHNYILAIQDGDYERAYDYLADKENKPTFDEFEEFFLFDQYGNNNTGLQIGETIITTNTASVEITVVEGSGGRIFFDGYNYVENARLVKENGKWKLTQVPYSYWAWEWYEEIE